MDERTYIRLHDGMPDHPKVVGLSDRAFRLFVESMCWCSRYLTDGAVTVAAMKRMTGYSPPAMKELALAGLLETGQSADWDIHDYTEHQRTAAEVAEIRRAKRVAGVAGNHERWHVARGFKDPACDLCEIDDASHVRSPEDRSDDIHGSSSSDRKPSPETESETDKEEKKLARIGSDDDPDFAEFWAACLRKVGKGQARKAYRAAVIGRRVEPKTLILAMQRFGDEARRQRTEIQYIPHPATWLNGERYNDIAPEPVAASERCFDF